MTWLGKPALFPLFKVGNEVKRTSLFLLSGSRRDPKRDTPQNLVPWNLL